MYFWPWCYISVRSVWLLDEHNLFIYKCPHECSLDLYICLSVLHSVILWDVSLLLLQVPFLSTRGPHTLVKLHLVRQLCFLLFIMCTCVYEDGWHGDCAGLFKKILGSLDAMKTNIQMYNRWRKKMDQTKRSLKAQNFVFVHKFSQKGI